MSVSEATGNSGGSEVTVIGTAEGSKSKRACLVLVTERGPFFRFAFGVVDEEDDASSVAAAPLRTPQWHSKT